MPDIPFKVRSATVSHYGHIAKGSKVNLNQVTLFVGESGTGKTTWLRAISRGLWNLAHEKKKANPDVQLESEGHITPSTTLRPNSTYPVISVYAEDRHYTSHYSAVAPPPSLRSDAYSYAWGPGSADSMRTWLDTIGTQPQHAKGIATIEQCLGHFIPKLRVLRQELISDPRAGGERDLLFTIADIAWRSYLLNPELSRRSEGIVFLDDFGRGLSVARQRTLIPTLLRVFPNMQFVIASHSIGHISACRPQDIVRLELNEEGKSVINQNRIDDPRYCTATELLEDYYGLGYTVNPHGDLYREAHSLWSSGFEESLNPYQRQRLSELIIELDRAGFDTSKLKTTPPTPKRLLRLRALAKKYAQNKKTKEDPYGEE